MTHYEVTVGNIGTVYSGEDQLEAQNTYAEYMVLSDSEFGGRATGEDVVLWIDGEPVMEFTGKLAKLYDDCL